MHRGARCAARRGLEPEIDSAGRTHGKSRPLRDRTASGPTATIDASGCALRRAPGA
nr:hypothetical protein [uncultured bacterium]